MRIKDGRICKTFAYATMKRPQIICQFFHMRPFYSYKCIHFIFECADCGFLSNMRIFFICDQYSAAICGIFANATATARGDYIWLNMLHIFSISELFLAAYATAQIRIKRSFRKCVDSLLIT